MTLISFESVPIKESNEPLVDLNNFDFILEQSYFNKKLSTDSRIFLREGVAKKLEVIQHDLKIYKFKIWDGFRSRNVQNNIYEDFLKKLKEKNPRWDNTKLSSEVGKFVTNANDPNRTPPHSTGGAIDLTLVDLEGKELDMGTGFDYFGPEASAQYFELNKVNEKIRQNRQLLRETLISAGFRSDDDEWWHFDYGNQLWAKSLHKPFAIYDEAQIPK